MCRTLGGGAHCACCDAAKCACHMSSDENNTQSFLVMQPAVFSIPEEFRIVLRSAKLVAAAPHGICMPDLVIPTPPPKD